MLQKITHFGFLFAIVLLSGCQGVGVSEQYTKCTQLAQSKNQTAACNFLYEDWDTLNSAGLKNVTIPMKAIAASLSIDDHTSTSGTELKANTFTRFKGMMESFGLFYPESIENLKESNYSDVFSKVDGELPLPMGATGGKINFGSTASVYGTVFSCASCHASRLYDADGLPTQKAWLGIPNGSYDVSEMINRFYAQLEVIVDRWPEFLSTYKRVYGVGSLNPEVLGLKFSRKQLKQTIDGYRRTTNAFRPYHTGSPGLTNGIAAIEFNLGVYQDTAHFHANDTAFAGAPVLIDRVFRSAFLSDGIYHVEGTPQSTTFTEEMLSDPAFWEKRASEVAKVATIFTIGTVGSNPKTAQNLFPKVNETLQSVLRLKSPQFPGPLNLETAARGQKSYEAKCAACHGTYTGALNDLHLSSYPNRFVDEKYINTDSLRLDRLHPDAINALKALPVSSGVLIEPRHGYVAPILTGLWITAPYLHNGSVPSIWALMHPESRPTQFFVGGHALRYDQMGIDYPKGYQPFSTPQNYDTTEAGHSNSGHTFPFDSMAESEKSDLLEYLKLL